MRGGRLVNGHLGGREQAMNAGEMGQRLRDARNRLGKTQEEVADELGVPANPVWHWEAGRTMPATDRLVAVAKLYGTSVDWILGVTHGDLATLDPEIRLFLEAEDWGSYTPLEQEFVRDAIRYVRKHRFLRSQLGHLRESIKAADGIALSDLSAV
jgi:transcriptional regulator with XRE-family HTH domain